MSRSSYWFEEGQKVIPGGVNSPVRAFYGVGGDPVFFKSAHGAYLVDEDNKSYVDYVGSWGPMILGHNHPEVVAAVTQSIQNGMSFGAPTAIEVQLAQKVCSIMPSIEKVRMVSSGTEATMTALRLARGFTGRDKIIKFEGHYHGHADFLLVAAGSGALTLGVPSSAGVPKSIAQHTLVASFNKLETVEELFKLHGDDIAAVILEPVAGNMNCVCPMPEFLAGLRELCDRFGSLLIIDEVMTGFRVALGGAQAFYNVKPDITTLGKVIGGGMPVGAFGARAEIMDFLAPLGPVYQAGTLSGNPVAMTAGLKTLELLTADKDFHRKLTAKLAKLLAGLQERADAAGIAFTTTQAGGMFGIYFTDRKEIRTFEDVKSSNVAVFKKFYHLMLEKGIYLAPSAYEAGFFSAAHTEVEVGKTLDAAEEAFAEMIAVVA